MTGLKQNNPAGYVKIMKFGEFAKLRNMDPQARKKYNEDKAKLKSGQYELASDTEVIDGKIYRKKQQTTPSSSSGTSIVRRSYSSTGSRSLLGS